MKAIIYLKRSLCLIFILSSSYLLWGQEVPIINYTTNANGQVRLEVNSTTDYYYLLKVKFDIDSEFEFISSMTLGEEGTTVISEPLGSYPLDHYQVLEYAIDSPIDSDEDGVNDIEEYNNRPVINPLNSAMSIPFEDGRLMVDSLSTFDSLSLKKDEVQWSEFLNGKKFVKFIIVNFDPVEVYFIHSTNHDLHAEFALEVGIDFFGEGIQKGQIIYHPNSISNNGTFGTYAFNYSNGKPKDFDIVQKTHEILGANMTFIENNLSYYVTENSQEQYELDSLLYDDSRIPVLFEADIYAGVDYWGLHQVEGYGYFRHMSLEEIPNAKDIVLYEALPNSLPRVAGIMTSVIQTPLSHVNIRAIQNNIPNAFVRDPLAIDSIANLLGGYIYYKVEQEKYTIREATLEEVNTWFEDSRPKEDQIPPLNLTFKDILPLDEIGFSMYNAYGAKCANIATMRKFDLPEHTIPDGFGIPFYFYQEFMMFNNLFDDVETMINDPEFKSDRIIRNDVLESFRDKIESASMPDWMLSELASMQYSFPVGKSIRCRSSSNNEDLPGFHGAGLYDSKTQHPDEGHISKSIKQVYASLWNLRAFEERETQRVDHYKTSMGVICHLNYSDEKANGVGVSVDPLYNTEHTFYLNTQVGEELITNPGANTIPEEILLNQFDGEEDDYFVLQYSNLVTGDSTIMDTHHLLQMRDYLTEIHTEFAILYGATDVDNFALDIEYKITVDDRLIIKQARPWVFYSPDLDTNIITNTNDDLVIYPNPTQDEVKILFLSDNISKICITNIMGMRLLERKVSKQTGTECIVDVRDWPVGTYFVTALDDENQFYYSEKFVKID